MTQVSRFWNGTTLGDATDAPYDADTEFSKVLMSIAGAAGITTNLSGVFRNELNQLAVTGVVTPVSVNTGRALTWGTWYENDVATTVAIPSPAGATRIDRIVLRKDWAAQTVRVTRIVGVEGGAAPALVQIAGTTWDEPLAQVSVTTGGVITVTDQREFMGSAGFPTPSGTNSILTSTGGVAAWSATPTIGGLLTAAAGIAITTGNLAFNGTAQRITGDMSTATFANRLAFQTSVVNGNTGLGLLPNGTATASFVTLHNTSNAAAAGRFTFAVSGTTASIATDANAGTEPTVINFGSALGTIISLNTSTGAITLNYATNIAAGNLSLLANNAYIGFRSTGVQTWLIGDGVGTTNGILSFYDYVGSGSRMQLTAAGLLTVAGGLRVSAGNIGVGVAPLSYVGINFLNATITTGAGQYGILCAPLIATAPGNVNNAFAVYGAINTAATGFTVTNAVAIAANLPTLGAGSAITTLCGVRVENQGVAGVANAYGVYIAAQSGAATANIGLNNEGTTRLAGAVTMTAASNTLSMPGTGATLAIGNVAVPNMIMKLYSSITASAGLAVGWFCGPSMYAFANGDELSAIYGGLSVGEQSKTGLIATFIHILTPGGVTAATTYTAILIEPGWSAIKIGSNAVRSGTKPTNQIDIFNGTAPTGTLTNGATMYASGGEMFIMDAAGNATLQSPHDLDTGEWIFHSKHTLSGKVLRVDMERLVKAMDRQLGGGYVREYVESY